MFFRRALSLLRFEILLCTLLTGIFTLTSGAGCSSGIDLVLTVGNIPTGTQQLRLLIRVDDTDAQEQPTYDLAGHVLATGYSIGLHLPNPSGTAIIAVAAMNGTDNQACILATTWGSVPLEGRQVDLLVNLDNLYSTTTCAKPPFLVRSVYQQIYEDNGKTINRIFIDGWGFLAKTQITIDGQPAANVSNVSGTTIYMNDPDVPAPSGSRRVNVNIKNPSGEMYPQTLDLLAPVFDNVHPRAATQPDNAMVSYYRGVASGDLNGDGKADLVVVGARYTSFIPIEDFYDVYINDGSPTFPSKATQRYTLQMLSARRVALLDVDGNGKADIVISGDVPGRNSGFVTINYNGGTPMQTNRFEFAEPNIIFAEGRFHGPSKLDFAILSNQNAISGKLYMLLNNGSGVLTQSALAPAVSTPKSIVTGDLNGDSLIDLILQDGTSPNNLKLFINDNSAMDFPFGAAILANSTVGGIMAAADFNNDKKVDLIIATYTGLTVLLSQGTTLRAQDDYAGLGPYQMTLGDFNRDGFVDVAMLHTNIGRTSIAYNSGDSTPGKLFPIFRQDSPTPTLVVPPSYPISTQSLIQVDGQLTTSDVNSDGRPDVVISNPGEYLQTTKQGSLQFLINVKN